MISESDPRKEMLERALKVGDTLKVTSGNATGLVFTVEKIDGKVFFVNSEDSQLSHLANLSKRFDDLEEELEKAKKEA